MFFKTPRKKRLEEERLKRLEKQRQDLKDHYKKVVTYKWNGR